jgi:hypothetical protein
MTAAVERIRREATRLTYEEREVLVRGLDLDLEGVISEDGLPSEVETLWDREIESRVSAVQSGDVRLLNRTEFSTLFSEARPGLGIG